MRGNNARLIDIPYNTSEPVQFVAAITAPLVAGEFVFPNSIVSFNPQVNLLDNTLYIINSVSYSVNIPEADYQEALQSPMPSFQIFTSGTGNTPLWRSGFYLPRYFYDYNYIKAFLPKQSPNQLKIKIDGSLEQTAALTALGIGDVTAFIALSVTEIKDDNYVKNFKERY